MSPNKRLQTATALASAMLRGSAVAIASADNDGDQRRIIDAVLAVPELAVKLADKINAEIERTTPKPEIPLGIPK